MERFPDFGTIPDVIVYDAIGIEEDGGAEITTLAKESESAVVVMSRDLRPDLAARAMAYGASGYFSIESDRADVVEMIRAAARGDLESIGWEPAELGAEVGLTRREVDVLCGVASDEQPRHLQAVGLERQHDQELHPLGLPKDGRPNPSPGCRWYRARLRATDPVAPGGRCGVVTL